MIAGLRLRRAAPRSQVGARSWGSGSRSSPRCRRSSGWRASRASRPSTRRAPAPTVGFGNLRQPLNPLEAFGIWPSGEFRITPANSTTPEIAFYLGGLLALAAFAWGLGRALSRRESALPSALLAATLLYLGCARLRHSLHPGEGPRDRGPADHADRPARPALGGRDLQGEEATSRRGGRELVAAPAAAPARRRFAVPLLTLAFAAAAAFSTLLPLRQAAVGPDYHLQEMLRMRPIVDGQNVLFLGRDNFVSWELIGSEVYAPITNHYDVEETPRPLPRDRPERQVRLGQRPAVRDEQVQLGGHDERGDAEPGAARLHAAAAHPRLHPLAPRPPGRAAPHPVRADQPGRPARLQRPRRGAARGRWTARRRSSRSSRSSAGSGARAPS